MPQPDVRSLPDFAEIAIERDRWAVFADVDGTLLTFAARPEEARPAPGLADALCLAAGALGGALALVSGRPIADVDAILGALPLAIAGGHGHERRRADGSRVADPSVPDGLSVMRAAFDRFQAHTPGTLVEHKTHGVALHYRQAPGAAAAAVAMADAAAVEAGEEVTLLRGNMVVEAKGAGADKGAAVRAFMEEAPFRGRTPVFLGDDVTDEDGFAAANDLGGHAVIVGDRRPTVARYRLADVAAVHRWIGDVGGKAAA